jgi:HD-GYP domain-containing protein (c-di-GMP phosphodiesterase class II)
MPDVFDTAIQQATGQAPVPVPQQVQQGKPDVFDQAVNQAMGTPATGGQKPPERTGWGIHGAPLFSQEEWQSEPLTRGLAAGWEKFTEPVSKTLTGKTLAEHAEEHFGKNTEGGVSGGAKDTWQLVAHLADFATSPEGLSHMIIAAATAGTSIPFQAAGFASASGAQVPNAWKTYKANPTPQNLQNLLTTMGFAFTGSVGAEAGAKGGMELPTEEFKGVEGAPRAGVETAKASMGKNGLADYTTRTDKAKGGSAVETVTKTSDAAVNKAAEHFAKAIGNREKNRTVPLPDYAPGRNPDGTIREGTIVFDEAKSEPLPDYAPGRNPDGTIREGTIVFDEAKSEPLHQEAIKKAFVDSAPYISHELHLHPERYNPKYFTSETFNKLLDATQENILSNIMKQLGVNSKEEWDALAGKEVILSPEGIEAMERFANNASNSIQILRDLMKNPENAKAIQEGIDRTGWGMAKAGAEAIGPAIVAGHFGGPFGIIGGLLWDIYRGKPIYEAFKRSPTQQLGVATEKLRMSQQAGYPAGPEERPIRVAEPTGGIPPVPPAEPKATPSARTLKTQIGKEVTAQMTGEKNRQPMYQPKPKVVGAGLEGKEPTTTPVAPKPALTPEEAKARANEQPKGVIQILAKNAAGENVGSLDLHVHPDKTAHIEAAHVFAEEQGKGAGKQMYLDTIAKAKAEGVTKITSDPNGITPGAKGMWNFLKKEGYDVRPTTHDIHGEGFEVDLTKPPHIGGTFVESTAGHSFRVNGDVIEAMPKKGNESGTIYRWSGVIPERAAALQDAIDKGEGIGTAFNFAKKNFLKLEYSTDGGKTWKQKAYQKPNAGPNEQPPIPLGKGDYKAAPDEKFDRDKFNDKGFVVMPPFLADAFTKVRDFFTKASKTEAEHNVQDLQARSQALGDIKKHDTVTFEHSIRTGNLGARLGEWMGLDPKASRQLGEDLKLHDIGKLRVSKATLEATGKLTPAQIEEIFAKLHDIGKLRVSKATLEATGKLTPAQIEEIFAHPGEGIKLLWEYGITTKQLFDIVGGHHEKFAGGGYPLKRAAKDMPLSVRIATVVDSFDAMTNPRGYNQPMTVDKAIKALNDGRGIQFDPEVVAVFTAGMKGKSLVTKEGARIPAQLLHEPSKSEMAISPFKQVIRNRWQEREATRAAERAKVKSIAEKSRSKLLEGTSRKAEEEEIEDFWLND